MNEGEKAQGIPPENLAALSHELRTPLSGVLGMAQLLEATPLSHEQRAYVVALRESGEHLLSLVNDVLDYARLGAAHLRLEPTDVDIEEVLRSVCELLSPRAYAKGIEIGWAAQAGMPRIVADEGRLRQILLNFAGNAVKFASTGGVLVTAEMRGSEIIRFTVSDTGPGIPPHATEQVFEAFARLDHGVEAGGAGLGLTIAKRIAEAMGGRVGVEAETGGGAVFWFEWTPQRRGGLAGQSLEGRLVVIASSSDIVREAAARQVEASGGRALRAHNLAEATALAPEDSPLLFDHPGGEMACLDETFRRPVVVLLRPEERSLIGPYRSAGSAGYLIKPLRRASLAARVLGVMGTLQESALGEDERIAAPPSTSALGEEGRVLLAEDNPINALLAKTLLAREGRQVDHVADGAAALAAATRGNYDFILMDVRMPGMGGIEATRAMRTAGIGTPIFALTADAFDGDRLACLGAGMDGVLVKPLTAEALRPLILRFTGSTRRAAQLKIA